MARPTHIYLVQRIIGKLTVGLFTDKHELITWLQLRPGIRVKDDSDVIIMMFHNAIGYDFIDVTKQIGEEM